MELREKLANIQQELKAPKGQFNSFGGYHYRSCEDILEAVKPLLKQNKVLLTLNDDILCRENRYYIKATATIYDLESDNSFTNSAFAREEENKKGMDGSQITGASSSYARKYALNGLFLIDDVKDSDTTNTGEVDENYAKNYVFTFGKHKGEKLVDLIEEEDSYIDWLLKNESTNADIIKSIEILSGKKPHQTDDEDIQLTIKFNEILNETGQDLEQILKHYSVNKYDELTKEQKEEAIKIMMKKSKQN